MQTNQISSKKLLWHLPITFAVLSLVIISSCKSKKEYSLLDKDKCKIGLSSSDINQVWVIPGYTNPKDPNFIDSLDVITVYDPISNNYTVYVQGLKKDAVVVSESRIKLFEGTSCMLPKDISIAPHNYYKLWDLGIFEADGKLKKFKDVTFKPRRYSKDQEILSYEMGVEGQTGVTALAKDETLPCPPCPNCKPPCEDFENSALMMNPKDTTGQNQK
jgi:hypothetical protein